MPRSHPGDAREPVEVAVDRAADHAAIDRAVADANAQGIKGKALTPFLLKRVSELSGGASQRTNQALLVHNARIAGLIARELTGLVGASSLQG